MTQSPAPELDAAKAATCLDLINEWHGYDSDILSRFAINQVLFVLTGHTRGVSSPFDRVGNNPSEDLQFLAVANPR